MNPTRSALTLVLVFGLMLQSCSVTLPVAGHFADKAVAKKRAPASKSHKWLYTGLVAGVAIDATIAILFINAVSKGMSEAFSNHAPSCTEDPTQPDC
jgi:hypothetical protein